MKRALMVMLAAGVLLGACQTNKTTGRSQFLTMSRQEEIQVGDEAKPEMEKEFGGEVNNAALKSYITEMGMRLKDTTGEDDATMPSLPWEFTLLDSDVVNAFALPGGKVFVTRGLAKELTNEAQLAAVMGHECGHVTARHSNERAGQQIWTTVGGALAGAAVGAAVSSNDRASGAAIGAGAGAAAGGIWALAYSRDQEIEADRLGMRYMVRLKYDPQGAIEVQQVLQRLVQASGGAPPAIFSTHPPSEQRIAELQKRLQKYYQFTIGNPEYVKNEAQYKQRCLSVLATLPPPPKPAPAKKASAEPMRGTRGMMASAVLGDPTTWCAVCAAKANGESR